MLRKPSQSRGRCPDDATVPPTFFFHVARIREWHRRLREADRRTAEATALHRCAAPTRPGTSQEARPFLHPTRLLRVGELTGPWDLLKCRRTRSRWNLTSKCESVYWRARSPGQPSVQLAATNPAAPRDNGLNARVWPNTRMLTGTRRRHQHRWRSNAGKHLAPLDHSDE